MADPGLLERLVKAARLKGGERLDFTADRPAVLVKGEARLQAGNTPVAAEDLEAWIEKAIPEDRLVSFQLGEEVTGTIEVAGEKYPLRSRQIGGVVRLILELSPAAVSAPPPAAPPKPAAAAAPVSSGAMRRAQPSVAVLDRPLDRMLRALVQLGGSDLHLTASWQPLIRLHGDMTALPGFTQPLSSEHILLMCDEIAPGKNRGEFREDNDTDFAYEIPGLARFRVNMFRDRRGVGAVFRVIPSRLMSFEELGLPESTKALCMLNKGLVLVTGPTGSGKSTTLATMIDYVNANRSDHIITIEDPIEFVHENKRCLVHQREVYAHTESFRRALRAALREDPDVVLVGELRDLETMAIAIETAETGHLVFGTLHTNTAVSTVDRLIDQFPPDRQEQVRVMVAESLKAVIAQILLKRIGGGRVAAYEILLGVPAVSNLIREGKSHQIPTIMQTSKRLGMRQMSDALAELVKRGIVDQDEAMAKAVDKDALRSLLKGNQGEPQA
ncbi:MAG TPA: type IV pilus twitching motility protein PilT [Thermoanaerobaculaceae bacterium]|nr:type IV pilus twitching motility protein PilT [Thermoanaerobaculaceae bacterium]HRS17039.1 type IV pilus twitching motility protein PilT [Thermoanaerobaculaceae bacterium]